MSDVLRRSEAVRGASQAEGVSAVLLFSPSSSSSAAAAASAATFSPCRPNEEADRVLCEELSPSHSAAIAGTQTSPALAVVRENEDPFPKEDRRAPPPADPFSLSSTRAASFEQPLMVDTEGSDEHQQMESAFHEALSFAHARDRRDPTTALVPALDPKQNSTSPCFPLTTSSHASQLLARAGATQSKASTTASQCQQAPDDIAMATKPQVSWKIPSFLYHASSSSQEKSLETKNSVVWRSSCAAASGSPSMVMAYASSTQDSSYYYGSTATNSTGSAIHHHHQPPRALVEQELVDGLVEKSIYTRVLRSLSRLMHFQGAGGWKKEVSSSSSSWLVCSDSYTTTSEGATTSALSYEKRTSNRSGVSECPTTAAARTSSGSSGCSATTYSTPCGFSQSFPSSSSPVGAEAVSSLPAASRSFLLSGSVASEARRGADGVANQYTDLEAGLRCCGPYGGYNHEEQEDLPLPLSAVKVDDVESAPILGRRSSAFDRQGHYWPADEGFRAHTSNFSVLSVSVPNRLGLAAILALFYSFLPYLILNFVIFSLVLQIGYFRAQLYLMGVATVTALFCEVVLKNLFKQPRPPSSAVPSHGMPSSHSAASVAVMVWLLLELSAHGMFGHFNASAKAFIAIFSLALFLPVPWARYWLRDHSITQVVAGCLVGCISGSTAFFLRLFFVSAV